jgi:tryptophan-rich sensory protein
MNERSADRNQRLALLSFLCFTVAAALFAARFNPGAWYASLHKPAWTPPGWLFGPVWTLLYGAMALAAWRAWRAPARPQGAMLLFAVQLVLNALWSWIFFGLHQPGLAFAEICTLFVGVAATAWLFSRADRLAGLLLLPYLIWVAFAAALNFALWRLN